MAWGQWSHGKPAVSSLPLGERLGIGVDVEMTIAVMASPPVSLTGLQEMPPQERRKGLFKVISEGREDEKKMNPQPLPREPLKACLPWFPVPCPQDKHHVSLGGGGTAQMREWGQDRGWPEKSRLSPRISPVYPGAVWPPGAAATHQRCLWGRPQTPH